jgi:DNA-binding LacI/PurR family transcriptional regulator
LQSIATVGKQYAQLQTIVKGEYADGVNAARRPTLADVAAAAGVSPSTASRALADNPLVNSQTRERVWEAARRLAFEPNQMARSLRTRSSRLVGMLLPDVAVASYASALRGAQRVLEDAGYQVMAMNTGRDPEHERAALRTLYGRHVDGVLVATSGGFVENETPVVFFDHVLAGRGLGFATPDNHGGVSALVRHLVEAHGHERIAYLGAPLEAAPGGPRLDHGSASERLEAFRHVMGTLRLPVVPEYLAAGDHAWSDVSAGRAARALLELSEPPTAIVAASDTLALGALRELRRMGKRVPGDVALVCFDDPIDGDLLDPALTALTRHYGDLGELAAGLLLEGLRGAVQSEPAEIRVPLELVVRASCGC